VKPFFAIILTFLLFNACFDQNDCLVTSTNLVKIELATIAGVNQNVRFVTVRQDSVDSAHTRTRHIDFVYYQNYPLGSLELPLDPEHDTTYFSFETADKTIYKLAFRYSTFSRVISNDCGAYLYYKDLSVIKTDVHPFDSTVVVEPQLFKSVITNVKVLF
jgi:Family of unknown function (DUF6452)